jgi:peroxiredoxin Q/BCP
VPKLCLTFAAAGTLLTLALNACTQPNKTNNPAPTAHKTPDTTAAALERTDLIPVGDPAPDFELTDQNGRSFRLSAHRGRPVVLIFYPKDFTPVCTKQLCAVRDDWSAFTERNIVVAGVNSAPVAEHRNFAERYDLPFPVLADPDMHVAAAYGCKGPGYPIRTVYAITPDGRIAFAQRGLPKNPDILNALSPNGAP